MFSILPRPTSLRLCNHPLLYGQTIVPSPHTFYPLPQTCSNLSNLKTLLFLVPDSTSWPASSLLLITCQFNKGTCIPLPCPPFPLHISWVYYGSCPIIPEKLFSCVTNNQDPNFHSLYLVLILFELFIIWLSTPYGNSLSLKTLHWFSPQQIWSKIPQLSILDK